MKSAEVALFVPLCVSARETLPPTTKNTRSLSFSPSLALVSLCVSRLLYLHRHIASPADHNRVRHHRDVVLLQILLIFLLLLVDCVEIRHRALRIHRVSPRTWCVGGNSVATTYYDDVLRARLLLSHWGGPGQDNDARSRERRSSLTSPPRWASGTSSRTSRRDHRVP